MIQVENVKVKEEISSFCQQHDVVMMVCEDGHVIGVRQFDALTIAAMLLSSASLYICDEMDEKSSKSAGRVN